MGTLTLSPPPGAGSAQLDYPNVVIVAAANGDYTTLSAALASITDAAVDNQYLICVFGNVPETDTVTAKSHVHVAGFANAIVTITATSGVTGISFASLTNTTWRDLHIVRAGAESNSYFGAVTFSGTTDATVRLLSCYVENTTTGSGSANHRFGCYVTNTAAPTLENCTFIGGTGAEWCIGMFFYDDCAGIARNCIGIGGGGAENCRGINIKNSAHPTLIDCIGRGGPDGLGGDAIAIYDQAAPILIGCTGEGGGTGACPGIKIFGGATPELYDCLAVGGAGAASIAYSITAQAAPRLYRCAARPPRLTGTEAVTATTTFALSATQTTQLIGLAVDVLVAGTGGATLSVGTTLGGTDIINAIDITSTGLKAQALGTGALKLLAGGADLYVTIGGTGSPSVTVRWTAVVAFTYAYALYIDSADWTLLDACEIVGGPNASACYITDTALTANRLRITNSYIEAMPKDASSKKAIEAQSSYNPAPIYNCVLVGGTTNITAAAGTAAGTNVIV